MLGDGVTCSVAVTEVATGAVAVAVRSSGELHAASNELMMRTSSATEPNFNGGRGGTADLRITSSPRR
jgi:hypothetical protein